MESNWPQAAGSPSARSDRPHVDRRHEQMRLRVVGWNPESNQAGGRRKGIQPGNAAACFNQFANCATSSESSSRMSIHRMPLLFAVPPGGTGRSEVPRNIDSAFAPSPDEPLGGIRQHEQVQTGELKHGKRQ